MAMPMPCLVGPFSGPLHGGCHFLSHSDSLAAIWISSVQIVFLRAARKVGVFLTASALFCGRFFRRSCIGSRPSLAARSSIGHSVKTQLWGWPGARQARV